MTTEPISDERLAEIRARLTPGQTLPSRVTILSILSRLDKAEAALMPFAAAGAVLYGPSDDDYVVTHYDNVKGDRGLVTLGDFRRAHSVLTPPPSES
jgi:hypothetical protein